MMDPVLSKAVVIAIASIGSVAWLAGFVALTRASREEKSRAQDAMERFEDEGGTAHGTIVGVAEVDGSPEDLSAKLAQLLARDGLGPLGPVKIVSRDRHEVVFETLGQTCGLSSGRQHGLFRLTSVGRRTRVEYAIETASGRTLLAFGWLVLGLALVGLIAGAWLEFTYIVDNPTPSIRSQSVQMVQVIHLLWPPFLIAYRVRQPARLLRARVETLVHNLPYA